MSDRTTEIREAVAAVSVVMVQDGYGADPEWIIVRNAARAYADLLDSDPLIIQRDKAPHSERLRLAAQAWREGLAQPEDRMVIDDALSFLWKALAGPHYDSVMAAVVDHNAVLVAARRWDAFPSDKDVEAAAREWSRDPSLNVFVRTRAALLAVKAVSEKDTP